METKFKEALTIKYTSIIRVQKMQKTLRKIYAT